VADPVATRHALDRWLPEPAEQGVVLGDTPAKLFHFRR
jgi:hypothetical protein